MDAKEAPGAIAAMTAPALFILAATSLAASALVRLARVVDRARALASAVHEGRLERVGASPETARRWLRSCRARARRAVAAVAALYAAIGLFVGACLTLGLQQSGLALPAWAPLAFVLPGVVLLLGAATWMASETFASQTNVMEEIEAAVLRLNREDGT